MAYNNTDRFGTFQSSGCTYSSYLTPTTSTTPSISFSYFNLGTYISLYTQEFQTRNGRMKFVKNDDYNYILELYDSNDTKVYVQSWTYYDYAERRIYICFGFDSSYNYGSIMIFAKRTDNNSSAVLTRSHQNNRSVLANWISDNIDSSKNFSLTAAVSNIVGYTGYNESSLNSSVNLPIFITSGISSYIPSNITKLKANKNKVYFLKNGYIDISCNAETYTSKVSINNEDGETLYDVSFKTGRTVFEDDDFIVIFAFGIDETNQDGYVYMSFAYPSYGSSYSKYMNSLFRSNEAYDWLKDNMTDLTKWKSVYGIKDSQNQTQLLTKVNDSYIYVGGPTFIDYDYGEGYTKVQSSERLTAIYNKINS